MSVDLFANSDLFAAGGWVLAAIMLLSLGMWLLIIERYLYLRNDLAALMQTTLRSWEARLSGDVVANHRLRYGLISRFHAALARWLPSIQVICAVLPLLGLLGTVTGMIKTFEVMTVFGSGNVRGMAEGISQALITTMAGLVTALSGLYFSNDLEGRVDNVTEIMRQQLTFDTEGGAL